MNQRVIQMLAAMLFAIRRAATQPEVAKTTGYGYNNASPLGCIGIRSVIAAWTADPTGWREDSYLDLTLKVPGVGMFRIFDPSYEQQPTSGYLVLSLDYRWLLQQRGRDSTLGMLASVIRAQLRAGIDTE